MKISVVVLVLLYKTCQIGEPGFRGDLVGELMKKLGIARRHSTPYYPQCNGLVEKMNGMIVKVITK